MKLYIMRPAKKKKKKCERKDGWEKRKRERIFSVLPKLIPFPISVLESLLRQILVKSG